MESWYFAYGSNLSVEQMVARLGHWDSGNHAPRVVSLANHRLVFQSLAPGGPAFANVLSPGDGVVGVAYWLNAAALQRLDAYEQGYQRRCVEVTDCQGDVLSAEVYVMSPAAVAGAGRPSAAYLETIVTGARQHGLPEAYIGKILAIAAARPV